MNQIKNSGYSETGASLTKKSLKSWRPTSYSSKSDLDANLNILRNRARELSTTPIGRAAINTSCIGAISSGLRLYPRINTDILKVSPEFAREWARTTKNEFEMWAGNVQCDFARRNNFYEIQTCLYKSYLRDGDAFCLFRRRLGETYTLKLQMIEAGRVSNPIYNATGMFNNVEMAGVRKGSRIVNGIEVDRNGRLEAVWISNKIWDEPLSITQPTTTWQRVKVHGDLSGLLNVLHICADNRPDMYRGEPYLAPVIETLKNVLRYGDAELQSAIIKSFFSLFFVQPEQNHDINNIITNSDDDSPCVDPTEYKLAPGTLNALPRGVDVKSVESDNAQDTFESFTNSFIAQVGAALNIPYELLIKKFQSSYSASKAALLQAEEEFRARRECFIQDFCKPVYEQFLIEAISIGRINAPGFFEDPLKRMAWLGCDFRTESNHLLDPVKELQAAKLKIELGLSTHEHEAATVCGTNWLQNIEDLKIEKKLLAELNSSSTSNNIS